VLQSSSRPGTTCNPAVVKPSRRRGKDCSESSMIFCMRCRRALNLGCEEVLAFCGAGSGSTTCTVSDDGEDRGTGVQYNTCSCRVRGSCITSSSSSIVCGRPPMRRGRCPFFRTRDFGAGLGERVFSLNRNVQVHQKKVQESDIFLTSDPLFKGPVEEVEASSQARAIRACGTAKHPVDHVESCRVTSQTVAASES
jgi:hypothetical protein